MVVVPGLGVSVGLIPRSDGLLPAHFRKVLYDRRGVGASRENPEGTFALLVQDCIAVADAAGLESLHVWAHFHAVFEALQVGIALGSRVRGLVLASPVEPGWASNRRSLAWRGALDADWDWFADAWVGTWGEPIPRQELYEQFKASHDPQGFRAVLRVLAEPEGLDRLAELRAPTLVIDRPVLHMPSATAQWYASRIPGATLTTDRSSDPWRFSGETMAAVDRFLFDTLPGEGRSAPASTIGPASVLPGNLSSREREILRLVCMGFTNPEIARALALSVPTVATHMRHILDKVGVDNRAAAAAWATRNGLA